MRHEAACLGLCFCQLLSQDGSLGNCPALVPHTEICTLGASMELLRTIGRGLEEERREAWSSV